MLVTNQYNSYYFVQQFSETQFRSKVTCGFEQHFQCLQKI